jgi:rhamnosyltransferase subunit B
MPLRILFVPSGSEGDVNPLLWLAEGMAARGHEPAFLVTPHYGRLIQQHGFPWTPIGTEEEFVRFARDPRLWHAYQGMKMFVKTARKPLNAFRREMDLPPLKNFYREAFHGAEGVAALFPEWFAPPQPDWPPEVRQFGFPVVICLPRPLPESLKALPVAWTNGSANFDIQHFQSRALAVSRELNVRCLLISLDPPEGPLPTGSFHIAHARFEDLFPRCSAVVHHGGIGTTAKCIVVGAPQLIIPRSHDQPDNASRVVKLGLGEALSYRRIDSADLSLT